MKNWSYYLALGFCISCLTTHAEPPPSCSGKNAILNIIDRPTVSFSSCTVPEQSLFIESGFAYEQAIPSGTAYNLPEAEIRLGLANNTEIDLFPPLYLNQNSPDQSGFGVINLGVKHIAYFDKHQTFTLQGIVSPPSGGQNYGATKTGFLINGIYNYNFDSGLDISTVLGVSSQSTAPASGTQTYYSFNPITVVSWPVRDRLNTYIEFYAQSQTGPAQGWGLSSDAGLIFLVSQNMTVDVLYGQSISGAINGIKRYVGGGLVIRFG